jgi:hypothetical protein
MEFMDKWGGLRKLGDSVARVKGENKSMYSWAETRLAAAGLRPEHASAKELILAGVKGKGQQAVLRNWLSLDEYMAEQFSRAAYVKGDVARSRVGKFFETALQSLRQLFKDLKVKKLVAPNTTFQTWLESQTAWAKTQEKPKGKFELPESTKKAQQEALAKRAKVEKINQEIRALAPELTPQKPPAGQVQPTKEDQFAQPERQEKLLGMLTDAVDCGYIEEGDAHYRAVHGYIQRGQFDKAESKLAEFAQGIGEWDREYASKVLERLPNKQQIRAETLRGVLAQKDITAAERRAFDFHLTMAESGISESALSREELERMVADTGKGYALEPFDMSAEDDELAAHGMWLIGLPEEGARTRIWRLGFKTSKKNHWNDPNYYAHSRFTDTPDGRFVVEVQSDLARNEPLTYNMATQSTWLKAVVQREIAEALEDGKSDVFFPTADTAAKIQS